MGGVCPLAKLSSRQWLPQMESNATCITCGKS